MSGDDGGDPGGRPNRNTRTGLGGSVAPTFLAISITAKSVGAVGLPPKLKAGAEAAAGAGAGGASPAKGAGAGAALLGGSTVAAGALTGAGIPKLKARAAPGAAFSPESATHKQTSPSCFVCRVVATSVHRTAT